MTKILFISGFNTHPDDSNGVDLYLVFKIYYMFSGHELEFFRYDNGEPLNNVYCRLKAILDTKVHDLILTHSMGSCLFLRYVFEHGDKRNAILCMPFIHATPFNKLICALPLMSNCRLPKCLVLPNHLLLEGGNPLNDEIRLINLSQPICAINHFFLSDENLVKTIGEYTNLRIIYSEDEQISPISEDILRVLGSKVLYIPGKHVSFGNAIQMNEFFEAFTEANTELLKKPR